MTITYDNLGNPLSYYNGAYSYTFTWTGRQLTGAVKGGDTLTFTYNDEGIRTSKTKNGVKTTYYLNGSQIVGEETAGNVTIYIYDTNGSPIGMQYRGSNYAENFWDVFWFEKNLQGDIVAVYSGGGTKLISYTYDAWGNHTTTYHNGGANTAAKNNPFRYRGYYYDADLSLYRAGSRYYDSYTGRWVNGDSALYHSIFGYNMYAYCDNNPVNKHDPTGENAVNLLTAWLTGAGTAALVEPTPFGEVVLIVVSAVIAAIWLGETIADGVNTLVDYFDNTYNPSEGVIETVTFPTETVETTEIKSKEEVDPHRRPGQKKQNGQLKNKARRHDDFHDRSNRRHGRDVPKKHTPGRGHKKNFNTISSIKIFEE